VAVGIPEIRLGAIPVSAVNLVDHAIGTWDGLRGERVLRFAVESE